MATFRIAHYPSIDETEPTIVDVTWDDLAEWLADFEVTQCQHRTVRDRKNCPNKSGSCWSPADVRIERKDENVAGITAAVFDVDGISDDDVVALFARLEPWTYVAHSTHSHRDDWNSFRLVMALSRVVRPVEWLRVWSAILQVHKLPADKKCKNLSRVYFLPRVGVGEVKFFRRNDGRALDVDELLGVVPETRSPDPALALNSRDYQDLTDLRAVLIGAANERSRSRHPSNPEREGADRINSAMLRRIVEQKAFALPGDWTGPNPDDLPIGRDDALNKVMSVIANVVAPGTNFDVIAPFVRMSVGAMAAPEGTEHWMSEACDMYVRAAYRRQERENTQREAVERTKASFGKFLARRFADRALKAKPVAEGEEEGDAEDPSPNEPTPDEEDYENWLQKDEDGKLRANGHNVYVLLSEAPDFKGAIRFNLLTKQIEVTDGILRGEAAETLATAAADWIQFKWKISVGLAETRARMVRVARDNLYDPVKEYLERVRWDGTPRIFDWLVRYCSAQTVDADGQDVSHWVHAVGRRWLIGLVARALQPGCQQDNVLVLEGAQGVGKTSLLRVLAQPWHRDDKIVLGEKDSRMVAGASWIVELGELAALKRGDVETFKQFFSQRYDTFRLPYGQAIEEFPRRCVFVGTTNEVDGGYLPDLTGNRRYWPIRLEGDVRLTELALVRDQLLAEAVSEFRAGEKWYFEPEEAARFEEAVTTLRVAEPTAVTEAISIWWKRKRPKPISVSTHQIATEALGLDAVKVQRGDEIRIGHSLRALGFRRVRDWADGKRLWLYLAPKGDVLGKTPAVQVCEAEGPRALRGDPRSAVRDAADDVA